MPRDILLATPEPEIKRQEAIHELIYTEEDYVRDLNLLDEVSCIFIFLLWKAILFFCNTLTVILVIRETVEHRPMYPVRSQSPVL